MGERNYIHVYGAHCGELYLYSHWDTKQTLVDLATEVISRRQRWDDGPYFARMLFSAMVKKNIDGETGYGLSSIEPGDGDCAVSLDLDAQMMRLPMKMPFSKIA